VGALARRTVALVIMVTAKAIAERLHLTRHWTSKQVAEILATEGFSVASLDPGPPILVTATSPLAPGTES